MNHEQLKEKALSRQSVREEYDAQAPETSLFRKILKARNYAGLSQNEESQKLNSSNNQYLND